MLFSRSCDDRKCKSWRGKLNCHNDGTAFSATLRAAIPSTRFRRSPPSTQPLRERPCLDLQPIQRPSDGIRFLGDHPRANQQDERARPGDEQQDRSESTNREPRDHAQPLDAKAMSLALAANIAFLKSPTRLRLKKVLPVMPIARKQGRSSCPNTADHPSPRNPDATGRQSPPFKMEALEPASGQISEELTLVQ
jgi:hypothetical protein